MASGRSHQGEGNHAGSVTPRGGHGFLSRWVLLVLAMLVLPMLVAAVAGVETPLVLQTWIYAVFVVPVLLAAWMVGIPLTGPFARSGCFAGSPWPEVYRSVVAVALGLGALALGTLLLGTCHLVEPGGHTWPLLLLPLAAAGLGLLPARRFLQGFDTRPLRQTVHRAEWLLLLGMLPVAMLLIAATFPPGTLWQSEFGAYDVLEYHLELPREYAANNSTHPLSHNVYSYLPANVEMLYLLVMQAAKWGMQWPSYIWGVYPAQFLHASMMVLTAMGIGLMPAPWKIPATARVLAALVFLGTPWTLVTGSLAYNEGGMMLYGTLALGVALGGPGPLEGGRRRAMVLLGLLLGLAVGSKMTAGIFFALPAAVIYLMRGGAPVVGRAKAVALAALVALAVYLPWGVRAAIYSGGNPVFPVAASWLGRDGWTAEQASRFARGHSPAEGERAVTARLAALGRTWLLEAQWSPNWYCIYRWANEKPPPPDDNALSRGLAVIRQVGLLWFMLPLALALALLRRGPVRSTALLLLGALVLQWLGWMYGTHLQSRFLAPTAVPLALLLGLAGGGLGAVDPPSGRRDSLVVSALRVLVCTALALHTVASVFILLPEAGMLGGMARPAGQAGPPPIGQIMAGNIAGLVEHPGESEAPTGKILLVGNSEALLYEGEVVYNTVFDADPLGTVLRRGGPAEAVRWLRAQHFNYVLIDLPELQRYRDSYGYDQTVTGATVEALIQAGLKRVDLQVRRGVVVLQVAPVGAPRESR